MRVLVTGANGHLGANLVRLLLQRGHQVRGLVRPESNLRGLYRLDLELMHGDVLRPETLGRALEGREWVFHLAARLALGRDPVIRETAVEGTRNVLSACAGRAIQRIVFTSSVAAVGASRDPQRLLTEADWCAEPFNDYARAKVDSERLAHALAGELGLPLVTVQPAALLGPHDWRPTPSTEMVVRFLRHGAPACPDAGLSITDVEDAALAHLAAAERGRIGERYILAGDNLTYAAMFGRLAELSGRAAPRLLLPAAALELAGFALELRAKLGRKPPLLDRRLLRSVHRRYGYYDASKARSELGFAPRPARETLLRAARWVVEAGLLRPRRAAKLRLPSS